MTSDFSPETGDSTTPSSGASLRARPPHDGPMPIAPRAAALRIDNAPATTLVASSKE